MIKKLLFSAVLCCLGFFSNAQSWEDLNKEVLNFLNKGDYSSALTIAMQAKDLAEKQYGQDHPDYSASLHNLASSYKKLGQYSDAEPLYWEALRIDKQVLGVKHQNYALSLFGLANLYKLNKDYSKAQAIYYDALDIMKRAVTDRHPDYSLILSDYGDLFTSLGKYDKAERNLESAKRITKDAVGEDNQDYAGVLLNLGKLYKAKGDKKSAETNIKAALKIYKESVGDMHPDYMDTKRYLENLDDPNFEMYPVADPTAPRVAVKTEGRLVDPSIPQAVPQVEVDESVQTLPKEVVPNKTDQIKGEPIIMEVENTTSASTTSSTNATSTEVATTPTMPTKTVEPEPKIETPPPPPPAPKKKTWSDYSSMMDDYSRSGDYDEAISAGEKALQMVKTEFGETHENYSWVSLKMAANYMNAGKNEKAIPIYEQDLKMIEMKLGTNNAAYKARVAELVDLYRVTGQSAKADEFFTKNIYQSLNQISISNLNSVNDQIADFYAASQNGETIGNQLQNFNMILKQATANSILGIESPSMSNAGQLHKALQKKLGVNEAAVDYMIIKDSNSGTSKYYALVTRFRGEKTVVVPLADDYKIQSVLSAGVESADSYTKNAAKSQQLYQLIWEPVESQLAGINFVSVSAVGVLNQVAFNALSNNNKLLADKYDLHFYTSMVDRLNKKETSTSNKSVVFFGGAEFGEGNELAEMPATKEEVNTFKTICNAKGWSVTSNVGAEAMESKAKQLSGSSAPGILHLATPVYLSEAADQIGMALNNANTVLTSGTSASEDGLMTGKEITAMNLAKTNLVILSATESDAGDGITAVHQAFKNAGVSKVLFTQWKAPDKQTQELLTLFYINHLTGMSPHRALASAQKDIRGLYKDPFFWAGFMIIE